jgi:hypothetical protein
METKDEVENSYILREYFKEFKADAKEISNLREKINKTDRNLILENIINQNKNIYNLVASNYAQTIDIVIYS